MLGRGLSNVRRTAILAAVDIAHEVVRRFCRLEMVARSLRGITTNSPLAGASPMATWLLDKSVEVVRNKSRLLLDNIRAKRSFQSRSFAKANSCRLSSWLSAVQNFFDFQP